MNNSVKNLLLLSEDELIRLVSELFVPKPWKHNWSNPHVQSDSKCIKCNEEHFYFCQEAGQTRITETSCTIPDPIDVTDWNVAMEWRDKIVTQGTEFQVQYGRAMMNIYFIEIREKGGWENNIGWQITRAQPRHYIIAAILAVGDSER